MSQIISFGNQKGGVAKTTSTINIGAALAKAGKRVLLVDMDPQASLTIICGFDNPDDLDGHNVITAMDDQDGKVDVKDCIHHLEFSDNLFLLPSDLPLARTEMYLSARPNASTVLKRVLKPIKDEFDFILIDCPPSLGHLTTNSICASTAVIACSEAKYQSMRGLEFYIKNLETIKKEAELEIKLLGVIITKMGRDNDSKTLADVIGQGFNILGTIPNTVKVSDSEVMGLPIVADKPGNIVSLNYIDIANGLIERFS